MTRSRLWLAGVVAALTAAVLATVAISTPARYDPASSASAPSGSNGEVRPVQSEVTIAGRPNIVFIMVDDMRDDDLSFMPHTRSLVGDRGARFVNSFSPYPLCCPARASVLSGQYTHNHRVFDVNEPYGFHAFDDHFTLATVLHKAGYSTVYIGKYLNQYGIDPPHGRATGNSLYYVPPGWTSWRASFDGGFPTGSAGAGNTYWFYDTTLSRDGRGLQPLAGQYQTRVYGRIARHVIRSRAAHDRPFFLYLSFAAPHHGIPQEPDDPSPTRDNDGRYTVWDTTVRPNDVKGSWDSEVTAAPGETWKDPDFSDKPGYLRHLPPLNAVEKRALLAVTRQRAEALTVVDRQVRSLLRTLATTGTLSRTLVVFTSDNGYFLGEQRMRQGKIFPHEPSLRVPLLMRGPGIPAGVIRQDPFTSIDFLPTLATAAGATLGRRVDGVSMWVRTEPTPAPSGECSWEATRTR